jgi:hypothetical protein
MGGGINRLQIHDSMPGNPEHPSAPGWLTAEAFSPKTAGEENG